jgi:DNA-binding response OmpR family regulator
LLLVEDEPSERLQIEEALMKAGHRVVAEDEPGRAADLLRNRDYPLAALITSVELHEGKSGWELAKLARQLRPDLAVVYLTRFSADAWAVRGVHGSRLVRKPGDPREVVSTVKAMLRDRCGGPVKTPEPDAR